MKKNIYRNILFKFLTLSLFILICSCQQSSLIDLQKDYLFAKSDQEKEEIINDLEEYYLNLSVPDSIRRQVEQEVQALIDTSNIDSLQYSEEVLNEPNVYILENKLKEIIKVVMIAKSRQNEHSFQKLASLSQKIAHTVDQGKESDYWISFIERIKSFSKEKALSWLKAEYSARYCKIYLNNDRTWKTAEHFNSLAFKYLNVTYDAHIYLDNMRLLQVILYQYRAYYELSFGIANKSLGMAKKIKYHLRKCGILYQYADALSLSGQNNQALNQFEKVINNANEHLEIPFMNWYKITGLLRIASVYWKLGQYSHALNICNTFSQLNLNPTQRIIFHNTRGNIERDLGNYENSEREYQNALDIAEESNKTNYIISIMINYGVLAESLTEFDKALNYYVKAKEILDMFNPNDHELNISIIVNIAEIMAIKKNYNRFDKLLNEADNMLKYVNLHLKKAQIMRTLGRLNLSLKKFEIAHVYFKNAIKVYEENNLFRYGLETKINLIECLIGMSRFKEAKHEIEKALFLASQYDDIEKKIDSIALLLKIQIQEGKRETLIQTSNKLIWEIEKISSKFKNKDRLVSYRQKIYDYLKMAVSSEIYNKRIDSAFVKLDYAKARSLKNESNNGAQNLYTNLDSRLIHNWIDNNSIVIDYLVMQDTLYVFVLDQNQLHLFTKSINMIDLRDTLEKYIRLINNTINVYQNYNKDIIIKHFDNTTKLGQKLFDELLGWPELVSRLKNVRKIFIIPDEFLYQLPFSTLVADTSDTVTYLANIATIVNLPCASFILREESCDFDFANKKVLISADPTFPGVKKFVSFIKSLSPYTDVLQIEQYPFYKENILEIINRAYDIYIVLGHGAANPVNPDLSYVEFFVKHPVQANSKSVKISMADLKSSDWSGAEMVMLIGCETAGGKLYRGTGVSGLQQELLALGAQNVLASLWKIDADFAIQQAKDILEILKNNRDLSLAIGKIQKKSIKHLRGNNYYKKPHPYFWGSYKLAQVSI